MRERLSLSSVAGALVSVTLLAASIWVLWGQLHTTTLEAIGVAIVAQPPSHLLLSLAFTALSFASQALYDLFAVRVAAPGAASPARALFAGFAANAIANTLGFHVVTASAVRYRIYGRAGMSLADVLRVISLSSLAIGLSYVAALAFAFLLGPLAGRPAGISGLQSLAIGLALAGCLTLLIAWLSYSPRSAMIARFKIDFPGARLAAIQLAIGVVEMGASVAALYVLIPSAPPFAPFAIAIVVATALGVLSHAPGAVGVFEASTILLLGGKGGAPLLAALLVYRVTYNLIPFVCAVSALGLHEAMFARIRPHPPLA
jgi:uncharacterized membrane protein YbhN (UPF0104 family)